jgi:DTW domain-containing protein YfiP
VPRTTRVPDLSRRCSRCLFRPEVCLCGAIPAIAPRTRFVIVRHAAERRRTTNSGRWAALALSCPVVDYGAPEERFDAEPLCGPGTALLFPDAPAGSTVSEIPPRVVVLDASWAQARRMTQRIETLRGLPRIALPAHGAERAGAALPRLRRPPHADGMSTIEAMARVLDLAGEREAASALDQVYAEAQRRIWALRGVDERSR